MGSKSKTARRKKAEYAATITHESEVPTDNEWQKMLPVKAPPGSVPHIQNMYIVYVLSLNLILSSALKSVMAPLRLPSTSGTCECAAFMHFLSVEDDGIAYTYFHHWPQALTETWKHMNTG